MISIRYTRNEDEAEYPIQDSVHCRIRDGAFGLRYDMDTGITPNPAVSVPGGTLCRKRYSSG